MTEAAPFIFISEFGPRAGGSAGVSRTAYLGVDGRVQFTEETTNGVLRVLELGETDAAGFFTLLPTRAEDDKRNASGADADGEVSEFTPKSVAVLFLNEERARYVKSFSTDHAPDWVHRLVDAFHALGDESDLTAATPGVYLRAQKLPAADESVYPPAAVFGHGLAPLPETLADAVRAEMALVLLGPAGAAVRLSDSVTLAPGRPAHVRIEHDIYRLQLFELPE